MGDAMAEPFAADGVVIGFDGSVSSGTQTISTDLSNIFADHETGRYAVKVHSVRPLGAAAAPPVWKPVSHKSKSPMCMLFVTTFSAARG